MRVNTEYERELEAVKVMTSGTDYDSYGQGFCDFLNDAPTVFHAVEHYVKALDGAGYTYLSERDDWSKKVKAGGKYYVTRNYTSLIAFTVGAKYWPGHGIALIGSHIDALTLKVKPVSKLSNVGFLQLKVAPYAVSRSLPRRLLLCCLAE